MQSQPGIASRVGKETDRPTLPTGRLQALTLGEFYTDLANTVHWGWLGDWWPATGPSCLIVATPGRVWDAKGADAPCPPNIRTFGWGGSDTGGRLVWIGWDLDVGHGSEHCKTTDLALADAFRIRNFLQGHAEIRLSKSGKGVHVRHRLSQDLNRPTSDGPRIAKAVAAELDLRADPTPLGRQAFWFWTTETNSFSFRLIWPHEGRGP